MTALSSVLLGGWHLVGTLYVGQQTIHHRARAAVLTAVLIVHLGGVGVGMEFNANPTDTIKVIAEAVFAIIKKWTKNSDSCSRPY